jgi:tetratricopeptide (TPR) repeat protein
MRHQTQGRKPLNPWSNAGRAVLIATILHCFLTAAGTSAAQDATASRLKNEIRIVEIQGTVETTPAGATTWVPAQTNQTLKPFDRLRTGTDSRVAFRWSDQSVMQFNASTELEVLPPDSPDAQSGLHLIRGMVSFFHRDEPGRIRVITRGALAGVEGTEFVLAVNDADRTTVSVIDGKVKFGNEQATLLLTNGEQAIADVGNPPVRTAGFIANNILQWCFYYPAVLDPGDLALTQDEQAALKESLDAYRAGDLLVALAKYPATRQAASDNERIYHAALLLSVGQVEEAETLLSSLSNADASGRSQHLAGAIRQLIFAVKRQANPSLPNPQLATEFLAQSYYEQSRALPEVSLEDALKLARRAATISPEFGFAWERVAELEFSFGHNGSALDALDKSILLAPRNAQALALKGFLLAAQNQTREAIVWFDRALAVDSSLGKPQNVIFVNGRPKLADLGLIAEIRPPDQKRTLVGTPGYMPPLPELPGTPQADIYALGVVLYVLSTGRNPAFFPEISTTLAENIEAAEFFTVNAIILKACQPDPAHRYASALEMHRALQGAQKALESGTTGEPPPPVA